MGMDLFQKTFLVNIVWEGIHVRQALFEVVPTINSWPRHPKGITLPSTNLAWCTDFWKMPREPLQDALTNGRLSLFILEKRLGLSYSSHENCTRPEGEWRANSLQAQPRSEDFGESCHKELGNWKPSRALSLLARAWCIARILA